MRFDLGLGFCALFPIKNFSLIYFYSFSFASDLLFKAISVAFREQERREREQRRSSQQRSGEMKLLIELGCRWNLYFINGG
jgi:hypothetical protein